MEFAADEARLLGALARYRASSAAGESRCVRHVCETRGEELAGVRTKVRMPRAPRVPTQWVDGPGVLTPATPPPLSGILTNLARTRREATLKHREGRNDRGGRALRGRRRPSPCPVER